MIKFIHHKGRYTAGCQEYYQGEFLDFWGFETTGSLIMTDKLVAVQFR